MNDNHEKKPLLEFPCHFPIKVMGEASERFLKIIHQLVAELDPTLNIEKIEQRYSSSGKYLSLTIIVYVHNQAQLDEIYKVLTSHELVKYVL